MTKRFLRSVVTLVIYRLKPREIFEMSISTEDAKDRIRRTITHEFVRMENDFDQTRNHRAAIVNKLMETVDKIKLIDENDQPFEENVGKMDVIKTALKAIADTEKATATAISLKLKQQEQEIASNNAAKDRIAIVLRATAPGRIEEDFPEQDLEAHLTEMFDDQIKDFELKSNPRDLSA